LGGERTETSHAWREFQDICTNQIAALNQMLLARFTPFSA
jgi:hypothetical protein